MGALPIVLRGMSWPSASPEGSAPGLCTYWPRTGSRACPQIPLPHVTAPKGGRRALIFCPRKGSCSSRLIHVGLLRAENLWGLRNCPGVFQGNSLDLVFVSLWSGSWALLLACSPGELAMLCSSQAVSITTGVCLLWPTPCSLKKFWTPYHPSPCGLSFPAAWPS